jgi:hypothetical protein
LIALTPASWNELTLTTWPRVLLRGRRRLSDTRDARSTWTNTVHLPASPGRLHSFVYMDAALAQELHLHHLNHGGTQIPSRLFGCFSCKSRPRTSYSCTNLSEFMFNFLLAQRPLPCRSPLFQHHLTPLGNRLSSKVHFNHVHGSAT